MVDARGRSVPQLITTVTDAAHCRHTIRRLRDRRASRSGRHGEVYRARDSKLGRDVALKILPDQFADDPERVARFQREAQLLASLNHPHIAAIYGLEEFGVSKDSGQIVRALVLELVEGPTLADRIAQGALPAEEALPIAVQIADAVQAAHEKGVVDRGLKPPNVNAR